MSSPGVQIHERTCVSHVTIQKGRVTGVETDRGRIQCEFFVNCAGQVELLKFFSFLFLLLKNMCTSLCFFFCFSFGFLVVCALAWFTGVDQVMLLISLSQRGCEGGKAVLAICCAPKAGC